MELLNISGRNFGALVRWAGRPIGWPPAPYETHQWASRRDPPPRNPAARPMRSNPRHAPPPSSPRPARRPATLSAPFRRAGGAKLGRELLILYSVPGTQLPDHGF